MAMAGALGHGVPDQTRPALSEEQRRSVFDGEAPSVESLCQRVVEGRYKRVVVLAGAGMNRLR